MCCVAACSSALVYFRVWQSYACFTLCPQGKTFVFMPELTSSLKLARDISELIIYSLHQSFWFLTDGCLLYSWRWVGEEGDEEIVRQKRLKCLKWLHLSIPMSDFNKQGTKKKKKTLPTAFLCVCISDTFWKCECVFVHPLSASPPGFRSWRWWRGWRSRARCTRARFQTAWCCWWTACKCCWCSRHSYSCPAPGRRFQRPTQRWIPVRLVPVAQTHAAVIPTTIRV